MNLMTTKHSSLPDGGCWKKISKARAHVTSGPHKDRSLKSVLVNAATPFVSAGNECQATAELLDCQRITNYQIAVLLVQKLYSRPLRSDF
jgi:hypothetical protein